MWDLHGKEGWLIHFRALYTTVEKAADKAAYHGGFR